jgi:uncharacterized protein
VIYLDTSAAIKVLLDEDGSAEMGRLFAERDDLVASRLLAVELNAVADRRDLSLLDVREVVDSIALVSLTDDIAQRAIELRTGLRTLDALHLATAATLGPLVTEFLSYDRELNAAAERHGIRPHPLAAV